MFNLITNQRNANWGTTPFHLQCTGGLCSADLEKNTKEEHTVGLVMATLAQGSREGAIVSRILAYLPGDPGVIPSTHRVAHNSV